MHNSGEELRILILEDMPSDAELEEYQLRDSGLVFTALRVDTRTEFERALESFSPDIVLADYRLPQYSGREALEYTRRTHPDIPVIMVTGMLGDEAAVELLKMGAHDYLLKNNLVRLPSAVQRALSEEQSERERKLAEKKYQALFAEAMDGIVLINCETWQIEDCNPEFERQTGRTLRQLKQLKVWEILSPEQHEAVKQRVLEISATGSGRGSNFTIQKPNSELIAIEYSAKLLNIQQRRFIQGITRDVTERLHTEHALRESEEKFRSITTSAQDAILMMDYAGTISYWNAAAEKIFGYSAQEALGRDLHAMLAPERFYNDYRKGFTRFKESGEGPAIGKTLELVAVRKDRTEFPIELSLAAVKRDGLWNAIGVLRDITERKHAEEALRRANRALQTLSAGNLALVHATTEEELLQTITNVIVEKGGYHLAAVCYAEHDAEKSITLKAWSSSTGQCYCLEQHLSWADAEQGQFPLAKAIRNGTAQICHDIACSAASAPCRADAPAYGGSSNLAIPLSHNGITFGGLCIYASEKNAFDDKEVRLLEELASDLSYGIITLRTRKAHEQHEAILRQSLEQSIQTIAATLEARDPYTAGHQRRVADLATAIAREMGLPEEQVNGVHFAAMIHDLGKIHVPAEILSKPGKLSNIEFMLIQTHSQAGYDIVKDVKFPWPIADIILQHHEKLDGSGYPQGLKGEQILLEARIITVADVVEAISSHRPYRPSLGLEAAFEELKRNRGVQYDPQVVDDCIKLFHERSYKLPP